jgi:hypothetical protein
MTRAVAVALLFLVSAPALATPPERPEAFAGSYRYAGGTAEIDALSAAIETVVQKMNFLIRGIARRRLKAGNQPSAELRLAITRETITVIRPGQPTLSAPANGTPITWHHDGDDFEVIHGADGERLYQSFKGPKSFSRNDFVLSADGQTLTVYTHIVSKHLPIPLDFHTTYRRVP